MPDPAIFAPASSAPRTPSPLNGALGGFAFVFIPALEIIAGYRPVAAGSALVPVTVVTLLLSGASGRLAQRIGAPAATVAGCLLCAVASTVAVRIGSHAGYWTAVFPLALMFGLGLASARSAGPARQRSHAPRYSPQPLLPGLAAPPRYDGRRSSKPPVRHLACPVSFAPGQTRKPDSSQPSGL
jgi:hypothetical protein